MIFGRGFLVLPSLLFAHVDKRRHADRQTETDRETDGRTDDSDSDNDRDRWTDRDGRVLIFA